MYRNNLKIDESIKVNSWGEESLAHTPLPQQQFYQKYATNKEEYAPADTIKNTPFFQSQATQLATMEQGFRRIKNQQMQKLKNLKSEYEEIKKITTDYEGPKVMQNSSLRSSRQMNEAQIMSRQNSKAKLNNYNYMGREAQILQLEKKQLEIMIQNSMKKIEELLHNQMEYKRTIHQLRISQDSKSQIEIDSSSVNKVFKKKEKDFTQQIRAFEIQRQNLLSNASTVRDKVKYLQSSLSNSQQELRKMFQQKRNYEQIIRMEKDKYLNLQIEFRRQKRQHQIIQKDKDAEINYLLKSKDVKEAASEKEVKGQLANLQEELKVKEKRYNLLLQQFENFKKDKTQEDKDQEAKIVSQLLSKTNSQNPSNNKLIQQTIGSILQRLSELQNNRTHHKDIELIENQMNQAINIESSQLLHQNQTLQRRLNQYQNKLSTLENNYRQSNEQNQKLRLQNQNLKIKYKSISESEQHLQAQVQSLTEQLRMNKLEQVDVNKVGKILKPQVQVLDQSTTTNYLNNKIRILQNQTQYLKKELEQTRAQREKVDDQNRNLLSKFSKLQFEVQKTKKQAEFKATMVEKQHQSTLNNLAGDLNHFKDIFNKSNYEVGQLKNQLQIINDSSKQEIARLKSIIQSLQKNKNAFDTDMKRAYNQQIQRIKKQHVAQLEGLTSNVQNITVVNRRLQEQIQRNRVLQDENIQLREVVKATRWNLAQNNKLQSNKEASYMNAASIISGIKMH